MVFISLLLTLGGVSAEIETPQVSTSLIAIEKHWVPLAEAVALKDATTIFNITQDLVIMRDRAGLTNLEAYSMKLLSDAERARTESRIIDADLLTRRALLLSPSSPLILFRSIPLVTALEIGSSTRQFLSALSMIPTSPKFSISILAQAIYPVLWAFTIALFLSLVVFFLYEMAHVLRGLSRFSRPSMRSVMTPLIALSGLILPIWFGPIITLACWSFVVWLSLPLGNWAPRLVGVLLVAWGVLIPLRETLHAWQDDPGGKALLNLTSGDFSAVDRYQLELFARARPDDGVAWFAYGQMLRKYGAFDEAREALLRVKEREWFRSYATAELGSLALLQGDGEAAKRLISEAIEDGLNAAAALYNRSQASLAELDTGSAREYLTQATKRDATLIARLRSREVVDSLANQPTLADIRLPTWFILGSLLNRPAGYGDTVSSSLMPFGTPLSIFALGIVLIGCSFKRVKAQPTKRAQSYYAKHVPSRLFSFLVRIVPGGSWVVSSRPGLGVVSAALVVLLAMPFLGWPGELGAMMDFIPGQSVTYLIVASGSILIIALVAVAFAEE